LYCISLRGRGGAAGRWSCGSGNIGFWSAGSSRRDGSVASGRCRSLLRSFSTGILSFFLILARVRAFSILNVILLLRHMDVLDEDLGVGIIHIAVGQLLAMPDKLWICGLQILRAQSAKSPDQPFHTKIRSRRELHQLPPLRRSPAIP
jgi:hypothetical protein